MAESYEKAGVNLEAGYEVVRRIKKHVASTSRLGVMGNIGAFGGMFDLSALNVKEPVLVSGTDGVGTKLKLAFEMDKHDTIGIDAVAMCVNDVLAQGAGSSPSGLSSIWGAIRKSWKPGCMPSNIRCMWKRWQSWLRSNRIAGTSRFSADSDLETHRRIP